MFVRARLQPCRKDCRRGTALAAEAILPIRRGAPTSASASLPGFWEGWCRQRL